jgi:predicted ATPase/class 3 adenylate cyclase
MITRGVREFSGYVISLLFTDIEGSTALWEAKPAAMSEALVCHDELLRHTIESHGGRVFKTVGDAFCAVFASTHDALAAAVAAQQAMADQTWPPEAQLRIRMAVHAGECEQRDDDFFGPTVNRVARLLAIGHGGQVLLSGAAAELVASRALPDVTLVDLGEHRLKDLGRREHVFEVRFPGQSLDFPPLRSLGNPQLQHNLPEQWSSFIGRDSELAQLNELFPHHRLITLVGPGGTGKTRLALQAVAERIDSTPDGVWLVELAPVSEPSNVASAVADTLGVREQPGRPRLVSIVETLKNRRLVVLLDNCEHVIEAAAEIVDTLLRRCTGVTVVATSREPLQIDGERVFHVAALTTPSSTTSVEQSDAVRLLVDRAQHHNQNFSLHNEDPSLVASLVRRLDGIPLAIELAAARLGSMSLTDIHQRLDQRFRLLDGGSRTALPRQRTLRAMIDWSYELLTEDEQLVLQRLTVFPSTWTLSAVETIVSDERVIRDDVARVHDSIVAKNLVQRIDTPTGTRYRLLDTVHAYAAEKLLAESDQAIRQMRARHLTTYLRICDADTWPLAPANHPARIEIDNLWAALDTALSLGYANDHLSLALAIDGCLEDYNTRIVAALQALLARSDDKITRETVQAELALGFHQAYTNVDAVMQYLERAVNGARELADPELLARSLNRQSEYILLFGDGARAAFALASEALSFAEATENSRAVMTATQILGLVTCELGNLDDARQRFLASLEIARTLQVPTFITSQLLTLGEVSLLTGERADAARYLFEARQLATTHNLTWLEASADLNLGLIATHEGESNSAVRYLHAALETFAQLGESGLGGYAMFYFASLAVTLHQHVVAATLIGAGDATAAEAELNIERLPLQVRTAAEASARGALDARGFAEAYERGRRMSFPQRVEFGLGYRPIVAGSASSTVSATYVEHGA